jgi:hypothetical protein
VLVEEVHNITILADTTLKITLMEEMGQQKTMAESKAEQMELLL